MSLIEDYHVVAGYYPVSPVTNPNIIAGMFVKLNSSGMAILATGGAGELSIGVSADNTYLSPAIPPLNTPYQASLTINSAGLEVPTEVRVSDPSYNETAASGRCTVYNSGGRFDTDVFETTNGGSPIVYTPGQALYVSANGKLTNIASTSAQVVGLLTVAPRAYPSGVPGTDTVDGSISLGSFLTFILKI